MLKFHRKMREMNWKVLLSVQSSENELIYIHGDGESSME